MIELSFSRGIGPGIALKSYLICEFVGRRNDLVLIDSGGLIIDSASHSLSGSDPGSWRLPGNPYLPPSSPFSALSDIPKGPGIFYSLNKVPKIGRKLSASLRESWHLFNTPQWEVTSYPKDAQKTIELLPGVELSRTGGERDLLFRHTPRRSCTSDEGSFRFSGRWSLNLWFGQGSGWVKLALPGRSKGEWAKSQP